MKNLLAMLGVLAITNIAVADTSLKSYIDNLEAQPVSEVVADAEIVIDGDEEVQFEIQSLKDLDQEIKESLYYRVQAGSLLAYSLDLSAEVGMELIEDRVEVGVEGGGYIDGSKRSYGLGPFASYTIHRGEDSKIYIKVGARYSKDSTPSDLTPDNKYYSKSYTGINSYAELGYEFETSDADHRVGVKMLQFFGDGYLPNIVYSYKPRK